jgi:hypothetical protein
VDDSGGRGTDEELDREEKSPARGTQTRGNSRAGTKLGSDAILMTFESRKSDHAGFEKVELSAAVHLALHELQFCDLTFCLSIGPGK